MTDPLRYETVDGAKVLTHQTEGETLFCVAYETPSYGDFAYLHAEDAGHARVKLMRSGMVRGRVRIIGIAPAVGDLEKQKEVIRVFT